MIPSTRDPRLRLRALSIVAMVAAFGTQALAHDFWIQPATLSPPLDQPTKIELRVGDGFPGKVVARDDAKIEAFTIYSPNGKKSLPGRDGDKIAGYFRAENPGLHIIAYRGKPSFITLQAEKFEAYLKEEGLEIIIAARAERGESAKQGTEMYSRCAKALVQVGEPGEGQRDRAVGLRLELIAQQNPAMLKPGDDLEVQILIDGKPLAQCLIAAHSADHVEAKVSARSDEKGMAKLKLAQPGMWVLAAVHMAEAPRDNQFNAQWESVWASLTLQVNQARK